MPADEEIDLMELFGQYRQYFIGVILGLVISAFSLEILGFSTLKAFSAIISSSIGNIYAIGTTLVKATPIILTGLAFILPAKSGFFNIGGDGQLHMGALVSVILALQLGGLPSFLSIPIILVACMIGGMAIVAVPLILNIKADINSIFTTISINYIMIQVIEFMCTGPIKDPVSVNPQTKVIPESTMLPNLLPGTSLHIGLLIGIAATIILYYVIQNATLGYKTRLSGYNPDAAVYSGLNPNKYKIISTLSGAALAALAGAGLVLGNHHLLITGYNPTYGYTGVMVGVFSAFRLARLVPSAIFFAILLVGGKGMQYVAGVPYGMTYVVLAVIVLSVLGIERYTGTGVRMV